MGNHSRKRTRTCHCARVKVRLAVLLPLQVKLVAKGCLAPLVHITTRAEDEEVLLLCLTAFLNLSTISSNQVTICRAALDLLLYICRSMDLSEEVRLMPRTLVRPTFLPHSPTSVYMQVKSPE